MSMPAGNSFPPPTAAPSSDAAGHAASATTQPAASATHARPRELGGRAGPEPTRFGDWEKHGRCIDF